MNKNKVCYQIKSLEIAILRVLAGDNKQNVMPKLTTTQMQIIGFVLEHQDRDIYQRDIEKYLGLRRSTVSGVLQTMEKNNFIIKSNNEFDARIKKIVLTDHTKQVFLNNKKKLQKLEKNIRQDISDDDLKVFFSVINKMKENISLIDRKGKD